jgi:RNA polymerase sigma-70 factor (ECF subfamily)
MDLGSVPSQQGAVSSAASIDGPLPVGAAARADAPAAAAVADDATLMLRYRDGDVRAFELLYERHKGPLYRYLQRMCGRREVADDLFQEVWSKVIASRSRYEARAQFNTFLFRIAHNSAIDYFRRSGRPHENAAQDIDEVAEQVGAAEHERPDAALSEAQVRSDFRRALAELPAEQRDVFVLYEESGLSLEEIGRVTGVAMETAKSRLRYAVGKLRTALRQHRPRQFEPSVQS